MSRFEIPGSWAKVAVVTLLILLPFLIGWFYRTATALPPEIALGTGPPGGQFALRWKVWLMSLEKGSGFGSPSIRPSAR